MQAQLKDTTLLSMDPDLDSDSVKAVIPTIEYINGKSTDWDYYAVLPGTDARYGVGFSESALDLVQKPRKLRSHRRTVAIPPVISESEEILSQLTVETTQWKLGLNNPYVSLRDDVDHTDAILDEIHFRRVEHLKRDVIKPVYPLHSRKKYLKARKPKYVPHFGPAVQLRTAYPFVPSFLHCATLFNRHSNYSIVSPKTTIYVPQFGDTLTDAVSKLRSLAVLQNLPLPENLLSRFEDLVLFFLQVKDVQSTSQLIAILIAYYKTLVSGSVLRSVEMFVHSLFSDSYGPQAGEPDDPDWLKYLREGKTTWNILLNCSAFDRVSKLLSLCVALGMCEASRFAFSIGHFKIFSIEAQKKHVTSLDLLDAFANTVFYFVEGGYRVFTTGSLAPLIYSDFEAKQFDDDSCRCERLAEFAKTGDLERLGNTTTNEFDNLLVNTIDKGHQLVNMTSSVSEKAVFRMRLDKMRKIQTELIQTRLSSGLRQAPFVVSFYGGSAQGKSSIAKIFMTTLLEANGFASDPAYICSVNENDKFQSSYRSCVNGVYVDDIGNAKADYVDRPPSQILIDLNNNVPTYALQAEADKKGKVVIEPKIVVCTSNVKDLGGSTYSNEPVSIARRANIHVTTCVKPEFSTNGMLDSSKVWKAFPDRDVPIQDIWDLTVEEVDAVKSIARNGKDTVGWKTIVHEGEPLISVSIEKVLRCVVGLSQAHFQNQERLVTEANKLRERLCICKTCFLPGMYCNCPFYGCVYPGQKPLSTSCLCTDTSVCSICREFSEAESICPTCDRIKPTQKMVDDDAYGEYLAVNHYCHCFNVPRKQGELVYTSDTLPAPRKYEGQFGSLISQTIFSFAASWFARSSMKFQKLETRLEEYASSHLFKLATDFENSWMVKWTNWIPRSWIKQSWCKDIVCYMERDSIVRFARSQISSMLGCAAICTALCMWNRPVSILMPPIAYALWHCRNRTPIAINIPIFWFSVGAPVLTVPSTFSLTALSTIAIQSYFLQVPQFHFSAPTLISVTLGFMMYYANNFLLCKEKVYEEIERRNDMIPAMVSSVREDQIKTCIKYCAIVGAIYGVCKIWSHMRIIPEEQANLSPMSMTDIDERDAEVNPWSVPVPKKIPCTLKSKSVTHETLCQLVFNNLAFMSCEIDGKLNSCDAFFPFSNVAIIPWHAWKRDELTVTFTRQDPTTVGANFTAYLSKSQSVRIPDTDFCLVWVPNGGDWKDLREYFPLGKINQAFATLVYKNKNGERIEGPTTLLYGQRSTAACEKFFGCSYVLPFHTFRGLCMAPLVTRTAGPMIGGFHVGGVESSPQGCGCFISIQQLHDAISTLSNLPSVLLSKSEGDLPLKLYDVQWYESDKIHPKSPLNFLDPGTNCAVYGSCKGRAKYFSEVVTLPISDDVAEVMGVPRSWGKPKFSTASWRESLVYSCNPSPGVEPSLLDKAVTDYTNELDRFLCAKQYETLIKDTRPLTNMHTVCGIDGKRFIDKMPPTTSVGYPLTGPKSDYIELLDPEDFPGQACPAAIDPRFWEEVARLEKAYLDGTRAYPIFKACLKDEPTSLDKSKVRVFQASPIALQLAMRKYFLPLARLLSLFPLISECAVGINAHGPEWDQLMRHVGRFGNDTTLAGDYSKYDLRMSAQLTFAAFRVLMHMAQRCGYTEYDIIIMSGLATDVCYPLMAYNGDLIQHYGSNPSGQNLTVYINCIVNSLLFRCGAIHILGSRFERFTNVCALTVYGDDADSTVNPLFPEFNHIAFANFLAFRLMLFTMPNKKDLPKKYMTREESHFLKRISKELGDTGILCGALEESSIFKSLHCVVKSHAVTTMEQSISNLNGAAREFFFHGPEIYESRRLQLVEVATRHNILPLCPDLTLTFEERLELWKEKYVKA